MSKTTLIITVLFPAFLFMCHHEDDPQKSNGPCVGCPIDFGLIDYEPAWSPDGSSIAYWHGDSSISKTGIYLIAPDGTDNHLWYNSTGADNPTWSPDGQWIAFSESGQIWKKKLHGDSLIQLTSEGSNFFPSWSPDGQWIAYNRSYSYPESITIMGIWKMNTNGSENIQIFSGNSGYPAWFSSDNTMFTRGDSLFMYSFVLNSFKRIFIRVGENRYPKYSAKNSLIVLSSRSLNDKFQIWTMNADGSNARQLTYTQGYSCDWSPDGQKIVYTDSRAMSGRLWIMNADGSGNHQLTNATQF